MVVVGGIIDLCNPVLRTNTKLSFYKFGQNVNSLVHFTYRQQDSNTQYIHDVIKYYLLITQRCLIIKLYILYSFFPVGI